MSTPIPKASQKRAALEMCGELYCIFKEMHFGHSEKSAALEMQQLCGDCSDVLLRG